jgi:saccharopine dehydrogenase-like NADP-dependent oxidoreductase
MSGVEIVVADKTKERAEIVASNIRRGTAVSLDVTDYPALVEFLKEFELVIGAVPGDYGYQCIKAAIEAGVNMVDVSFIPENPLELDDAAKKAEVTIIPDCGFAPGLSNMLVGYSVTKLERIQEVHIFDGGIPEYPVPPLGYTITWSAEGLIDEYTRDARIIKGGRVVYVPALSGLEVIDFPGIGRLEAFYVDGLRTLLNTVPSVDNMWEKVLRYPGHVRKIKLLKILGFFDKEPISVTDISISPRLITARVLERSLKRPEVGDMVIMTVKVTGERDGELVRLEYYMLDRYDRTKQVSAMARTTGYTASIVAKKLAQGIIKKKGIVPPERLGMDSALFKSILLELREKGIKIDGINEVLT